MKYMDEFGKWLADTGLSHWISKNIEHFFTVNGMGAVAASTFSVILAFYIMKAFWVEVEKSPPEELLNLDPDDDEQLLQAFNDIDFVLAVSYFAEQPTANTFEEFKQQVRETRFNILSEALNADDIETLKPAFESPWFVLMLSKKLETLPPCSFEEFCLLVYKFKSAPIWLKFDHTDQMMMEEAFAKPKVVKAVAKKVEMSEATSLETFIEQVELMQKNWWDDNPSP